MKKQYQEEQTPEITVEKVGHTLPYTDIYSSARVIFGEVMVMKKIKLPNKFHTDDEIVV